MSGGPSRNIVALLTVFAVAISVVTDRAQAAPSKIPCTVDRDRLLALDQQAFDQAATGWRELAGAGCYLEAADIIRDWRMLNVEAATILPWHEGQMRANANHYRDAILLFNESRKKPSEEMAEAWNIYVDGSIAFLQADRPAFKRARARLARTARPTEFNPVDSSGGPLDVPWPPNLAVLDSLLLLGAAISEGIFLPSPALGTDLGCGKRANAAASHVFADRPLRAQGSHLEAPRRCFIADSILIYKTVAMNRLKFRYIYDASFFDPKKTRDDFGRLSVSVATNQFSATGAFWVQWQDIREFGEALSVYPITEDSPVIAQWGFNMQEGDDLILRFEIAPADARGNLGRVDKEDSQIA